MDSVHGKTASGVPLPDPVRVADARARLERDGQSVADWAAANGENVHTVYKVLGGDRACIMGASRRIAAKLGIIDDITPRTTHVDTPPAGTRHHFGHAAEVNQ